VPPSARCTTLRCRRGPAANVSSSPLAAVAAQSSVRQSSTRCVGCSSPTNVVSANVVRRNPQVAEAALRSWTPVFIHGDLQIVHVLDDGDEASGVGDWSEGGQGDAMYNLATLTLAHEEHLDDVMAGYGGHIEIDVIRAYWSLRSLMEIRWLVSTATARRRRSHRSRC